MPVTPDPEPTWTVPVDPAALYGPSEARIRSMINEMPRTLATPAPIAELLDVARQLFLFTIAEYRFGTLAVLLGFQAVEAALRDRLNSRASLDELIQKAAAADLLSDRTVEALNHGRRVRNEMSHPTYVSRFNAVMIRDFLAHSHRSVAELYPNTPSSHGSVDVPALMEEVKGTDLPNAGEPLG